MPGSCLWLGNNRQLIIFNWQPDPANKMKKITLSNVVIHNFATKPGANLTPMNGSYPDANKTDEANAYGIWARGVTDLKLKSMHFLMMATANGRSLCSTRAWSGWT